MKKMGFREVQKPAQDCTARNQQSQLGTHCSPARHVHFIPGQFTMWLQQVVLSRPRAAPLMKWRGRWELGGVESGAVKWVGSQVCLQGRQVPRASQSWSRKQQLGDLTHSLPPRSPIGGPAVPRHGRTSLKGRPKNSRRDSSYELCDT